MIKPYFYFVALLLHIAPIFGLEINGYIIGPNASLSNANLVGADLSGIDLTGSNLHNANLTNANLSNAILRDCNLNEAKLENANLSDADVTKASMVYAWLHGTNISGVDLSTANLDKIWTKQLVADNVTIPLEFSVENGYLIGPSVTLYMADLKGLDLSNRNLSRINFHLADLTNSNLNNCNLTFARFDEAILQNTNLSGANISNSSFVYTWMFGTILHGIDFSNSNLNQVWAKNIVGDDLNLPEGYSITNGRILGPSVTLYQADLKNLNLANVDFSGANLHLANLSGCDLTGANLSEAKLDQARLISTNLTNANLKGASLSGAELNNTIVTNTNFYDSDLNNTFSENLLGYTNLLPSNVLLINNKFKRNTLGDGLIAHVTFDFNGEDQTNNGNNATYSDSLLGPDRFGNPQHAVYNPRSSNAVKLKNQNIPIGNNDRTFSFWVKPERLHIDGEYQQIIHYGDPSSTGASFTIYIEHDTIGLLVEPNNDRFFSAQKESMNYSHWHHLAWSIDANNGHALCVLDGRKIDLVNDGILRFGSIIDTGKSEYVNIAGGPFSYKYNLSGGFDDLRIYNRKLNLDEVVTIYELEKGSDYDGDGLSDFDESLVGTDNSLADTDGDGLTDLEEIGLHNQVRIFHKSLTYERAKSNAKQAGGHLVTINSHLEYEKLRAYLGNLDFLSCWIGGEYQETSNEWKWYTGEPMLNVYWDWRYPNSEGMTEPFIQLNKFPSYGWTNNDNRGVSYAHKPNSYLVEFGYSSNPLKADTDDDGINDLEEFNAKTNPYIPTYQINIPNVLNGQVEFDRGVKYYDQGESAIISAIPDNGYQFLRWGGDVDTSVNPLSISVNESIVLLPIFQEAKPPLILFEHYSGSLIEGQSQLFEIGIEGTQPISLKWFKDGISISNDGDFLQLSNVTADDQGIYSLTASNDYGSVTADLITISVLVPLNIGTQSGNLDIIENESISIGFAYSGSEPTEIQWFKDGNPIVGANSPKFIKHAATLDDSGIYSFKVTNELGTVEGEPIVVTVSKYIEPPSVTEFLLSPNPALVGSQIVLSVAASGEGPFEFQWFYEDSLLATTELPLLSIDNVSSDNSGPYTVRVTNQAATAISEVVTLNVVTPVILDKSPEDVLVMERNPFELSVQVSGSGDLTYSWFKDDQPIALPSTSTYSVESAFFSDTGKYHVVISNGASSIQSTTASVLVTPYIEPPGIIIQPKNKRVHLGDPSSMVVSASGATPLNYQWFLNGEALFGAVQSFYLIDSVSRDHVGTYTVSISNEAGSVTSNPASLNLIVPLEVLTQSSDVLVTSGDSFQLSVTLNSEAIQESYWSKDGNRIEEALGLDYEVLSSSLSDAGNYIFHATDGTDWVQSNVIIVTVNQPPVFKSVPEDRSVVDGQRIMLQWIAQGTGKLTYELLLDGQVLDSNNSGNFWVTPFGDQGNTEYTVKVSNAFGNITSEPVTVTLEQSNPEIVKQPRNIKLVQGEPLEMMIQASGGSLKYQWYKGASQIPEATGAIFRIGQTSVSDAGDYFVVVSNNKGIVTSKPIKVGFGVKVAVEINGANLVLKMNPGNSQAQWKLQKSSNLLFWQDVQDLTSEDLNGLAKPIGTNTEFYRVVEK